MQLRPEHPVFIIGCPRSGNTLLGAILNKHPELLIIFEGGTFSTLYRIWQYICSKGSRSPGEQFQRVMIEKFSYYNTHFKISAEDIADCACIGAPNWSKMLGNYMCILMARAKPSARRWGDKTPHHVGNILHIKQQYPKARFIYTYRDPRSVVTSLSQVTFPYATNNPMLNAEIVRQYLEVYEDQRKQIDRNAILEVRYESLVSTPEQVVRRVCEFLEIDYETGLLDEADDFIRGVIGWPDDKAWGKIVPQATSLSSNRPEMYVDAYLVDWITNLGYHLRPVSHPLLRKIAARLRVMPFRITRSLLTIFWGGKYPGYPLLLRNYPSIQDYKHWLSN